VIAVLLALLLALVLIGLGFTLIALAIRAGEGRAEVPRWARVLSWLLGLELTLFGAALLAVLAHAWVVYAQAT
jgi:hypothetical protein